MMIDALVVPLSLPREPESRTCGTENALRSQSIE
jgi:hypothetical protein